MPFQLSKSRLAIILSQLKQFESPALLREQYVTDSEIAAEILWFAYMNHDLENRKIADLGCGTGILGIGALLLGAEMVYFVDSDENVLKIARQNVLFAENEAKTKISDRAVFMHSDIKGFAEKVDSVIQNPPFGTKQKHADKPFLEKAFKISKVVYSIHKAESKNFIEKISQESNFRITNHFEFHFPIKATQKFHKRKIYRFKAGCWRMESN